MQPFCSEASFSLSIRAHSYSNPHHRLADGSGCDVNIFTTNECDSRFTFCLRRHGTNRNGNANNCPLGSYSTGKIGDDAFTFGSSSIASGVPNPMIFRGSIWEVSKIPNNNLMRKNYTLWALN